MQSPFCRHGCPLINAEQLSALRRGNPMRVSSSSSSKNYLSPRHHEQTLGRFRCRASSSDGCSRRDVIRVTAAGTLSTLMGRSYAYPGPAIAALVDEEVSMRVFDLASPSVVSIINYKVESGVRVAQGVGTGVVWDRYGHIATNYHVISKLDKTTIPQSTRAIFTDVNGHQAASYSVELVGSDAMHDLAVLRIIPTADDGEAGTSSGGLEAIQIGRSSDLKVGQFAFAIGNTYGLTKTLSVGIVSGLNRSIPSPVGTRIYGVVQTDASINAGNSGGPLLDSRGRMVGMNTATFTRSGTGRGSGINFALPIDALLDIVPKLIVYGNASGKRV